MGWKDILLKIAEEDAGTGDPATRALFPAGKKVRAAVVAEEAGIAAGIEEARFLLESKGLAVKEKKKDGDGIKPYDALLEISGDARALFDVERTAVNILMRLSGIATETKKAVEIARKQNKKVRIAATKKTTLGVLDKNAVALGGGDTHRLRLDDCILIKSNHVRLAGGVRKALGLAKNSASFSKKIEIEVRSAEDALEAARLGADIVMLDNFSHAEIEKAMRLLKENGLRKKVLVEVSGGINFGNLTEFARHEVDVISMGCLTNAARPLGMSLKLLV